MRETIHIVEYKLPDGHRWKTLEANGQPLIFSEKGELDDSALQKIVNSQNVVAPGRCEFRWTTRNLAR